MARRRVYIGSLGAHLFDDEVLVNSPSGLFEGQTYRAILTDGAVDSFEGNFDIVIHLVEEASGSHDIGDATFVVVDASTENIEVYLPRASLDDGRILAVTRIDDNFNNQVNVYPNPSEPLCEIDDEPSQRLYPRDSMSIFSHDNEWRVY